VGLRAFPKIGPHIRFPRRHRDIREIIDTPERASQPLTVGRESEAAPSGRLKFMLRIFTAVALIHGCLGTVIVHSEVSGSQFGTVSADPDRDLPGGKRRTTALDHYRRGIERLAKNRLFEAITSFREAIWADRTCVPAYNQLGGIYSKTGDHLAAVEFFRQGLKIDAASVDAYVGIARALEAEGKLENAASYYWGVTKVSPNDAELRNVLGQFLSRINAVEQAVEQFELAVRLEPERAEFHRDLGSELSKLDDSRKALRHLREAVRINPDISNADFFIGRELVYIGEHRDAVRHLRRAIQRQENAGAHHLLGVAYESLDLPREGLQSYQAAMRKKPDWVLPMVAAAWLLATNPDATIRDPDFAVTLAERLVRTAPKPDARFLDVLAAAYAAKGEFARAVSTAEAALKAAPDDDGFHGSAKIAERLKLYRNHKPFMEPWSPGF